MMPTRTIARATLYFLWNPGQGTFSGYGLTAEAGHKDHLVGLLMVDRPHPVDPNWLSAVENAFGGYTLHAMTATGERGILCQMWIEKDSLSYLRRLPTPKSEAIRTALTPLLDALPNVHLEMHWDKQRHLWRSTFLCITAKGRKAVAEKPPSNAPLFPLGQVVATPGALEALEESGQEPIEFLRRHVTGDWGQLDKADIQENEYSLKHGLRLLSSYRTNKGTKIWVITEADRSSTCLLLPSEY
jgi:hypothetical protein